MPRAMTDGYIDGGLNALSGSTRLTVCAGEPVSILDIAARLLAQATGLTGANFTISNGSVSGRRNTVGQQTAVPITNSGAADHIVIDDGTDWAVTVCPSQALTAGGSVTVQAHDYEVRDPAAP